MIADAFADFEDYAAATEWMDGALCAEADPEAWFPPEQAGPAWWGEAVHICQECPIRLRCLAYAVDNDIAYGVWGGLTEQQRRPLPAEEAA